VGPHDPTRGRYRIERTLARDRLLSTSDDERRWRDRQPRIRDPTNRLPQEPPRRHPGKPGDKRVNSIRCRRRRQGIGDNHAVAKPERTDGTIERHRAKLVVRRKKQERVAWLAGERIARGGDARERPNVDGSQRIRHVDATREPRVQSRGDVPDVQVESVAAERLETEAPGLAFPDGIVEDEKDLHTGADTAWRTASHTRR
jgi:hypothetical protein